MIMDNLPIVRTSERALVRKCPQAWFWAYRMGLVVPDGLMSDHLWLGIGVHEALAQWYKKGKRRGRHPAQFFDEWAGDDIRYIRTYMDDEHREWYDEPKYEDAHELGFAMLENYVEEYGKDSDWEVLATEQPFKVKISRQGQPLAYFASRFDGVIRSAEDGQVYLLEHKTAGSIRTAYLDLDDQAGAYWAVASSVLREKGILGPKENIAGIIYNFLRKWMGDDRPQDEHGNYLNKDGSVSKKQPPPAFQRETVTRSPAESRTQMERLAAEV